MSQSPCHIRDPTHGPHTAQSPALEALCRLAAPWCRAASPMDPPEGGGIGAGGDGSGDGACGAPRAAAAPALPLPAQRPAAAGGDDSIAAKLQLKLAQQVGPAWGACRRRARPAVSNRDFDRWPADGLQMACTHLPAPTHPPPTAAAGMCQRAGSSAAGGAAGPGPRRAAPRHPPRACCHAAPRAISGRPAAAAAAQRQQARHGSAQPIKEPQRPAAAAAAAGVPSCRTAGRGRSEQQWRRVTGRRADS